MKTPVAPSAPPVLCEQIIAFADVTGYHRLICAQLKPEEVFAFLGEFYAVAQAALAGTEGRIVKFIGDAAMVVFPAERPGEAVAALRKLQGAVNEFLARAGYESQLRIRAHVGPVAVGVLGSGELERFDIAGLAVNEAALLGRGEWVLSEELRRRVGE